MFFLNMIQLNLFINKNIVNFILLLYKLMRCFMRKRLLIVFSVLLFLLCLSVVSATDENTNSSIVAQDYDGNEFYVDLGGDDSNSGQLNSPFNSINKAVEVSKSNDNVVIHLGEGTFEGNGNVMISINKAHLSQGGSITIVGAGADKTIIKGSSAYYAFNIYADSVVTLRDLSIVDCKSVEGGAICNSGTLLVDNCIFRNNFAFNTGGAISSIENGDCKIYNSVFINNSVICNDEYENANGGAVYSLKSDLLVDSCRFVGNFAKDNFFYDNEMMTYICPLGQPLYKISEYTYKNKSRISHWTKECKICPMQLFCSKGNRCRVIQDYGIPSKIRMQRKMETPEAKERYKIRSKTVERPFAHLKQNMHLTEFRTTGLQEVNTELKLYTIGHNLKRIYNEISRKNN